MHSSVLFLLFAFFASSVEASCVHNGTHCQCATIPAGGNCLKYFSGAGSNTLCDIYPCGEGVVCDCLGDSICEVAPCESSRTVYRPTSPLPPRRTDPVSCELAPRTGSCVTRVGPLPPSPSPAASLGQSCASLGCESGLTCRCEDNICVPSSVGFQVHAIGDDIVRIFTCDGGEIGIIPTVFDIDTFQFDGVPQDLIVIVRNLGGPTGLALAITYEGVTYASGVDLTLTVAENPPDGFLQCCTYDYSPFGPTRLLTESIGRVDLPGYTTFANLYNGALPVTISDSGSVRMVEMDERVGESVRMFAENTDYVYRVSLPFFPIVGGTPIPIPTPSSSSSPAAPTPSSSSSAIPPTPSSSSSPAAPTPSSSSSPAAPTPSSSSSPAAPTPSSSSSPAAPTPSSSSSAIPPTPSSSSSPAAPTPSSSSSPVPPTPSASASSSSIPAPTPSPVAGVGESCATLACESDLTCRCGDDVCVPTVEYFLHAIGDDEVTIYTCDGGLIGTIPLHDINTFQYSGICQDLIVVVHNVQDAMGLAVAITHEGVIYSSSNDLPVTVAQDPAAGYLECCNYDYSSFVEPRLLTEHIGVSFFTGYINFANAYNGGRPLTFPGAPPFLDNTDYVFRVSPPFCPPSTAVGAPSPSAAAPTPSASASPIPALPTPSTSPVPSPLAGLGESCAQGGCQAGLTCRCNDDVCVPTVQFDVHAIGDDEVTIYSCDGNSQLSIPGVHEIKSFQYDGICQDLIVAVNNINGEMGLAIAVTHEGVTYTSGSDLPITVAENPLAGFGQCCKYDYSSFVEPRLLTEHIDVSYLPGYTNFAKAYNGARPVTFPSAKFLSNTIYVFRVSLPFCPSSVAPNIAL